MVFFPFAILAVTTALFASGVAVSWFQLPIAAGLSIAFGAWVVRRSFPGRWSARFLLAVGVAAGAFTTFVLLEAAVSDGSWDGRTYHALAIEEIADGWNLLLDSTPDVESYPNELHYFAKGPWVLAATLYRFSGSFDGGKAFHSYLILTAYLFWVGTLLSYRGMRTFWALVGSVPIALNPVSGAQLFTHYVDGQLASLLAIVVALLVLTSKRRDPVLLSVLAMALALAIGTKLNGALYVGVIGAGFWIWHLIARRDGALVLGLWLLAGVLTGAGVTGYNPYTSQFAATTIAHGNPFHPHPHWSSIINLGAHSVIPGATPLGRLTRSLLARSVIWPEGRAEYKIPFTMTPNEVREFASPDVRLGGFGPLFSGGLLLAAGTLLVLLRRQWRLSAYADPLVLTGLLLFSVVIFPEAWWARLAPQLAFVPVMIGVIGLLVIRQRPYRYLPVALVLVLVGNSLIVLMSHAYFSVLHSSALQRQLAGLRRADAPVTVSNLKEFPGLRLQMDRAGVAYYETESLPCPEEDREEVGRLDVYICDHENR